MFAAGTPTPQDARSPEHFLEPAVSMDRGTRPRDIGYTEVANFSSGPLRPSIDLSVQKNARPDTLADHDENEISFSSRSATPVLPLRGKVSVILDSHRAIEFSVEYGPQRNTAPPFQHAQGENQTLFDIDNGGNPDNHPEQLVFGQFALAKQTSNSLANLSANRGRTGKLFMQRGLFSAQFAAAQIGKEESEKIRPDFDADYASAFSLEPNDVGRSAAGRITFANRFDESRGRQMRHNICDRGRTQSGSARQVGFGAGPRLTEKPQQELGIRLAQERRPCDQNWFFLHFRITVAIASVGQVSLAIMLRHFRQPEEVSGTKVAATFLGHRPL